MCAAVPWRARVSGLRASSGHSPNFASASSLRCTSAASLTVGQLWKRGVISHASRLTYPSRASAGPSSAPSRQTVARASVREGVLRTCRHQRTSEGIRGHQRSSEGVRGHQRSSEVIRGHQRASYAPCSAPRRPSKSPLATARFGGALAGRAR